MEVRRGIRIAVRIRERAQGYHSLASPHIGNHHSISSGLLRISTDVKNVKGRYSKELWEVHGYE